MTHLWATLRRDRCRLLGRGVEIWVASLRPPGDACAAAARYGLPAGELERIAAITDPWARTRHAAGRVLARYVLSRRIGLPVTRIRLTATDHGRPCLSGRTGLDFNLSHSGSCVALAICAGLRVGVDIEQVVPRHGSENIARRIFAPHERELLARQSDGPQAAIRHLERWYRIWTTREAHAKARGVGVRGIADPLPGHGTEWQRRGVRVAPGYVGSLVALRLRHAGSPGASAETDLERL